MIRTLHALPGGALALAVGALHAPAAECQEGLGPELPVVERTLDNGLHVLVLPRGGAPTVSFVVQYDVGGVNEVLGSTGTAHLLEHMLFKGTTTVGTRNVEAERELFPLMDAVHDSILALRALPGPPDTAALHALDARLEALEDSARTFVRGNEFDRILSQNGARSLNATTSEEATTYFVELPSNRARLWFVLEADRMANPVFREFYSERDVVAEERRMRVETSPGGLLYEQHLATAFQMHPYGVPVIGYMSDLQTLTRDHVRRYYERYYGPNNAVVAIVGDVDPDRILELAEAYLGGIRPGEEPPPVLAREPEQRGERRVDVVFDAEPRLRIGWHTVSAFHEDWPALVMLSTLLTGGRTSRLYRSLVLEERLAAFVSSSQGPGARFPGLFTVDATPRSPHEPSELEASIYREIDRLRTELPDDADLQRVRNQLEASRVRRLRSNLGLAFQLAGSAATYGDWRTTFDLARRIQGVTPEDIQRVVRRYLVEENRTVATLVREERPAVGEGRP